MYKELVRRNVVILAMCLIIFALLSVYITNLVNRNNTEKQLVYLSDVVAARLQSTDSEEEVKSVVDDFTDGQDWLNVVVAGSHGFYDPIGEGAYQQLDSSELKLADSQNKADRTYIINGRMYYIQKITDDVIMRTSVVMEDNVELILYSLFIMAALLILTLALSVALNRRTSGEVVDAFNNVTEHLRSIGDGNYTEILPRHKFEEVAEAYRQINTVNSSIVKYLQTISTERDKANFIVNNILEGLLLIKTNGEVYVVNKQAQACMHLADDCVGKQYTDVIPNSVYKDKITQALTLGQDVSFDVYDESGRVFFVKTAKYRNEADSETDILFVVLYDVTTERQEERNKAEFIANASHELKTPITAISGFAELLLSGLVEEDGKRNEYVKNIYDASRNMRSTVEEMLYLSKIDEAHFSVEELESVNLPSLSQSVAANLQSKADARKITVQCVGSDVHVKGKEALLKHLVTNLVDNAIKYNAQGGFVTVTVENAADTPTLSVRDTGYGIEKQNLERIFDRFFRTDNKRYYDVEGVGLGLSIAKKICDLHGAKLTVESQVGVGTTFTVTFSK